MPEKLQAEIQELVNTNAKEIDGSEVGCKLIEPDKAVAIAMMFIKRETQKVATQSRGNIILGIASQVLAGSFAAGPVSEEKAVKIAQRLIAAVEKASAENT